MCHVCSIAYSSAATGLALSLGGLTQPTFTLATQTQAGGSSQMTELQELPILLQDIKAPEITEPKWLTEQKAAERAAKEAAGARQRTEGQKTIVTYEVTTKGTITANFDEFKRQANATLNDARGWARMDVVFSEVASGGQFTLVLSEAALLPSFSPGCGVDYSCNAGRYVIINQDRWLGATPSWNTAGGSLRDYRHMVVNHETGHWLGHGHSFCGGAGQAAPVMQQQSIDLQGCKFNPWPLAGELTSTRLGI